jgi:hypothetical protein
MPSTQQLPSDILRALSFLIIRFFASTDHRILGMQYYALYFAIYLSIIVVACPNGVVAFPVLLAAHAKSTNARRHNKR